VYVSLEMRRTQQQQQRLSRSCCYCEWIYDALHAQGWNQL